MINIENIIKEQTPKLQEYISKRRNANCLKCGNKIEVNDLAISETYNLVKNKKIQRIFHKKCYAK